jgi:hypothetical protein
MFIDREFELDAFEKRFKSGKPELVPIYGRRRVGKTELIKQFSGDKKSLYLLATLTSEKDMLEEFSARIADFFKDEVLKANPFRNWDGLFTYLAQKTKEERIVVTFDEFPYLVRINEALPSILQKYWDEHFSATKIFLILCGSSIGMMEREVLAYKAPLYGRRTGQLLLGPLDFGASSKFFPNYRLEEKITAYAILGGVPAYLLEFTDKKSIGGNVRDRVLGRDKFLYNEIQFLLREELREPANYFSILRALSLGKTALNEVVQATGLERGTVARFLSILIDLKIVERKVPVTERHPHKSRKGVYKIADNFFNFWFRFIYPNRDRLEMGREEDVLRDKIVPALDQFISSGFEEVCRQTLWKLNDERALPFVFEKVGSWWEKGKEIDLVALNERTKQALFAECKWSKKQVDLGDVEHLERTAENVDWYQKGRDEHFAVFSKSGFRKGCLDYCKANGVLTFDLTQIGKIWS